jgi:alpha-glucosidase
MLLLTLRGTPTLYYGDELGMTDVVIPPARVQDRFEKNVPGLGLGRDPARTPMPWDGSPGAGFSAATPWLPLSPDTATRNVATLDSDPGSILTLYRRLIALRRSRPALSAGHYRPVVATGDVLAYWREHGPDRVLVVLNLGTAPATLLMPDGITAGQLLLSTHGRADARIGDGAIALAADEGVILAPL